MYELYNGDCLEVLPKLISLGKRVNAVICDVPYGTTLCSWDEVIPFIEMWELLHKIAPNAPIVLFSKQPFTSALIMSNIKEFSEHIVWLKNKSGNGFSAEQRHIQVLEEIIVFSEISNYTFNPQKWLVAEKEFLTQRKTFKEHHVGNNVYGEMKRVRKPDTGERNPINIVSCRVPFTPSKGKKYSNDVDLRYHPTQKPLELMEYLVETYSNEGDVILDFTCGVASTGVAALNKGRYFIGIEKEKNYYDIGKKRLDSILESNIKKD